MKVSRTQKSIMNTVVSFASQFIIILLGFISRRVLIYSVGVEYLGINGLMTNILTIFSLAESGIGLAIVDEIVALHGGKLNIISEESFGTTVTIELPIYNED